MELIDSQVLAADAASIDVSGIPGDGLELLILGNLRTARAAVGDDIVLQFNGDTGTNYDWMLNAIWQSSLNGTAAAGIRINTFPSAWTNANNRGPLVARIGGYADITRWKTVDYKAGYIHTDGTHVRGVGEWRSLTAITALSIFSNNGADMAAGSRLYVYKVG